MSDLNSFLSNVRCIAVKIQMQVRGNAASSKLENPMSVLPYMAAVSAWRKQCLLLQLGTPNKIVPEWIHHANTKGPWSEARSPSIRAPGPRSCGLAVGIRNINPCRWSTDRGPSKTNQRNLSPGNAGNRSTVRSLLPDRALVLCLRSTGLRKMVQEPRAGFHVAEWRVFCHPPKLRGCPARLNQFCSDSALMVSL